MSTQPKHWFDRLSVRQTRRQTLATGLLGAMAAATGFSLAEKTPAAEAAPRAEDCRKGCVWVANQTYTRRQRESTALYFAGESSSFQIGGFVLGPLLQLLNERTFRRAADEHWQRYREEQARCFEPFCPGFDPDEEGGPCDGCDPPFFCNPCSVVEIGYVCCTYEAGSPSGDCCTPTPAA